MIKQLSTGLIAGAVAVLALVLSRPVSLRDLPLPPPASPTARSLIASHAIDTTQEHAAAESTRAAVRAKLDKVVPLIEFEDATLPEVVQRFAEWTGANFILDPGLDSSPQSRVTIRLTEMRAGDALHLALATARPNKVGYRIWSGAVLIGDVHYPTLADIDTRLYDVRDLLDEAGRQNPAHLTVPQGGAPRDPVEDLMRLIQENVDPAGWRDAGGDIGVMSFWAGRLAVSQTAENHQRIERFLGKLRESIGSKK